jgi:crotonobetainyl-CoA:carnitine CoA-transferase CaiB-like acyl-CoA transferase
MEDLFKDPQVQARNMLIEMPHPTAGKIKLVGSPIKLSRTPVEMKRYPPLYNEHTDEIFSKIGFTKDQIKEMEKMEIIGGMKNDELCTK